MTDATTTPDPEPLGAALRRLRKLGGRSQTWVAEQMGVTQQAYSAWESGTVPSVDALRALEHLYDEVPGSLVTRAHGPLGDDTQTRLEGLEERVTWLEDWKNSLG